MSASRNKGLEVATGEYVSFIDADDTIEPTMYEELYKIIEKNNIMPDIIDFGINYVG